MITNENVGKQVIYNKPDGISVLGRIVQYCQENIQEYYVVSIGSYGECIKIYDDSVLEIIESGGGSSSHGIPAGGNTGDFLVKASDTDYDVEWITLEELSGGSY